jgi:hypothetical protein
MTDDLDDLLDLLDRFVKDSISLCDKPSEQPVQQRVKGMKIAFIIMEGFIHQCRTPEGRAELRNQADQIDQSNTPGLRSEG